MFRDVIKRTLIVFMMFATLNMFLGCNTRTSGDDAGVANVFGSSVDEGDNTITDSITYTPEPPPVLPVFDLDNGMKMTITDIVTTPENLQLYFYYSYPGGGNIYRRLKIHLSLMKREICNTSDEILYGQECYMGTDTNTAILAMWTNIDTVTITNDNSGPGIINTYNLNGDIYEFIFETVEQYDYAAWLYDNYDSVSIKSLPDYEQSLFYKIFALVSFLDNVESFENNDDIELLNYLMNDEEFYEWLSPFVKDYGIDKMAIRTLCTVGQAIATLTCQFAVTPVTQAACAFGLSITVPCLIYDLYVVISGWFD